MIEEKNCQTCLYGITDKHYSHCDDSDIDEDGICMGWELSPVEKIKQERETVKKRLDTLAVLIKDTHYAEYQSINKMLKDMKHNA